MSALAKIVESLADVAFAKVNGESWGSIAQGLGATEAEVRGTIIRHNKEYMSYLEMANAGMLEELKAKFKRKAMELVDQPDLDPKLKVKVVDCVYQYLRSQLTHVQKMQINARMAGVKEKPTTKPRAEGGAKMKTMEESLAEYEALSKEREQLAKEYEEVMARLKQKK